MAERPSTPPPPARAPAELQHGTSPITPEQVRQMEIRRLKAKALREQWDQEQAKKGRQNGDDSAFARSTSNSNVVAGQKRLISSVGGTASSAVSANQRDARHQPKAYDAIQPARNFTKFVEYDFSKMTDTKGGFLTAEDDPHNKVLHANLDEKPAQMTLKEWERQQLLRSLRDRKAGPFEPGLTVLEDSKGGAAKVCRECGSLEIDWKWEDIFHCRVCNACKEKYPEKYSLLTKTEAREDYLLTDPELKDEELLPHLERPNPHKSTWNNMMLYLRYQVEEYAFSDKKWGSEEAMDEEFQRRESGKKKRKEDKFRSKLQELKKKTRVEAWRRSRAAGGGAGAAFGDEVSRGGKHSHVWGRTLDNAEGVGVKTCVECGMEVEELEF